MVYFSVWFTLVPSLQSLPGTNTSLTCRKLVSVRIYWYRFDVNTLLWGCWKLFSGFTEAFSTEYQLNLSKIIAESLYIFQIFALLKGGKINSVGIKDVFCLHPSACDLRTTPKRHTHTHIHSNTLIKTPASSVYHSCLAFCSSPDAGRGLDLYWPGILHPLQCTHH